jgi:hypothetical protein
MKTPTDIVERFRALEARSRDPLVVNEDGTRVDPYIELAKEMFGEKTATFEQKREAQVALNQAIQGQLLRDQVEAAYRARQQQWGAYNQQAAGRRPY